MMAQSCFYGSQIVDQKSQQQRYFLLFHKIHPVLIKIIKQVSLFPGL